MSLSNLLSNLQQTSNNSNNFAKTKVADKILAASGYDHLVNYSSLFTMSTTSYLLHYRNLDEANFVTTTPDQENINQSEDYGRSKNNYGRNQLRSCLEIFPHTFFFSNLSNSQRFQETTSRHPIWHISRTNRHHFGSALPQSAHNSKKKLI